ncbi:syntaxin of plants 52 [Rhynchospora pubera]|uniref:Syntaxin of plants 52 n=1 Tax=Rhynchospora pubera TaxID=906938 RepID=A0AAV8ED99_9POAL|nr:syntaxin of plants 52 [Rhynchospora pubera]
MANPADLWMKVYEEASRLADDVSKMLSEYGCHPLSSGPETLRRLSSIRRHITNLGVRLGILEADLSSQQKTSTWFRKKEIEKRKKMLSNLRERETQMASALNMWYVANGGKDLAGSSEGAIRLQEEIIQEQDEVLDIQGNTVLRTKHFALALYEEVTMHTRLMDSSEEHVEVTDSCLQRVQKRLATLNKRNKAGCSCMSLLMSVVVVAVLALITWMLILLKKKFWH